MTAEIVNDNREPCANPGPRDPADPSRPMPQFQPVTNDDPMQQFFSNAHYLSTNWRTGVDGPVDSSVNQAVQNVQQAVSAAAGAIRDGDLAAYKAIRNLDIHPDGRTARSQQAITEAQAKAGEHIETAQANLSILTAILEQDAMPKMVKGEESTARADIQMVLSGAGKLDVKLRTLAADDGSIGALVTDSKFLRLALMSQGVPTENVDNLISITRQAALQAAANSSDPARQTAAKLLPYAKRNLNGAIMSAQQMRRHVKAR